MGGLGEFGMNSLALKFKTWFLIDMGLSFSKDRRLGVDFVVPNKKQLERIYSEGLGGILITHAHEDHIGALPYLYAHNIPVYASPFAASLIETKFQEAKLPVNLVQIEKNKIYELEPELTAEWIPIEHSIPQSHALLLKNKETRILHTGDFKFPLNSSITQEFIQKFKSKSVDLLFSDSTNCNLPKNKVSESEVIQTIKEASKHTKGRIIITVFPSNIERIAALAKLASELSRKIFVCGKSFFKYFKADQYADFLLEEASILPQEEISYHYPHQSIVLVSGSQGEMTSALHQIAFEQHPHLKFTEQDLFIYSAKIIPQNITGVQKCLNRIAASGATILKPEAAPLHSSGHPSQEDCQNLMIHTRPRFFIPIHGSLENLYKHEKLARSLEPPPIETLVLKNQQLVSWCPKGGFSDLSPQSDPPSLYRNNPQGNPTEVERNALQKTRALLKQGGVLISCIASHSLSIKISPLHRIEPPVLSAIEAWASSPLLKKELKRLATLNQEAPLDFPKEEALLGEALAHHLERHSLSPPVAFVHLHLD